MNWLFQMGMEKVLGDYLQRLDRPASQQSPFAGVQKKFFVAMTARTGSTFLCQKLSKFGIQPHECFNLGYVEYAKRKLELRDYGELCTHLVRTESYRETFGVKGHIYMTLPLFLVREFPDNVSDWKFVYLTRDNLVRQAISGLISRRTGSHSSWDPPTRELTDSDYSKEEIAQIAINIIQARGWWEHFFAIYDIEPLRISYETLVQDLDMTLDRIAEHCQLTLCDAETMKRISERARPFESQATRWNAIWEARFRAEAAQFAF